MKNLFSISLLAFILTFTSCDNDKYVCTCEGLSGGPIDNEYKASSKNEAEDICEDYEDDLKKNNPFVDCEEYRID